MKDVTNYEALHDECSDRCDKIGERLAELLDIEVPSDWRETLDLVESAITKLAQAENDDAALARLAKARAVDRLEAELRAALKTVDDKTRAVALKAQRLEAVVGERDLLRGLLAALREYADPDPRRYRGDEAVVGAEALAPKRALYAEVERALDGKVPAPGAAVHELRALLAKVHAELGPTALRAEIERVLGFVPEDPQRVETSENATEGLCPVRTGAKPWEVCTIKMPCAIHAGPGPWDTDEESASASWDVIELSRQALEAAAREPRIAPAIRDDARKLADRLTEHQREPMPVVKRAGSEWRNGQPVPTRQCFTFAVEAPSVLRAMVHDVQRAVQIFQSAIADACVKIADRPTVIAVFTPIPYTKDCIHCAKRERAEVPGPCPGCEAKARDRRELGPLRVTITGPGPGFTPSDAGSVIARAVTAHCDWHGISAVPFQSTFDESTLTFSVSIVGRVPDLAGLRHAILAEIPASYDVNIDVTDKDS